MLKKSPTMKRGYELVFTVLEYYDGPRKGIASYRKTPHFFDCIISNDKNEYSEKYFLTPLDDETYRLAMEASEIFRKWEIRFHDNKRTSTTSGAYLLDTKKYRAINRVLDKRLVTIPRQAIIRIGHFDVLWRPKLPKGVIRPLQVKWTAQPTD
jgi:hypothetical protein